MKTESRKCNDNVLGDRGNKMNWKSIKKKYPKAFKLLEEKMNDIKKEEELWLWIEQKLIEARIDEQRRNIGMFLSLPDSEFTDLQIQSILLNRISELEK